MSGHTTSNKRKQQKKPRRARLSVKAISVALNRSAGNVSLAAKLLGVNRTTIYKHINASPVLQGILQDARDELVDLAESALRQEILAGNTAAIIFTLKTVGRDRGYIEPQWVNVNAHNQIEAKHDVTVRILPGGPEATPEDIAIAQRALRASLAEMGVKHLPEGDAVFQPDDSDVVDGVYREVEAVERQSDR